MNRIEDKIEKIVVNVGLGKLIQQQNFKDKILPAVMSDLAIITGQKPSMRGAKKSIAGFKIREGDVVGLKVTLRKKKMVDFLNRLDNIVIPRLKDFRGLTTENVVDSNGNLNIGLKDQLVFPEIDSSISRINFGLQVTAVAKHKKMRDAMIDFYRSVGVPLRKS